MALSTLIACALVVQNPFPTPKIGPDLGGIANLKTFLSAAPLAPEHRMMLAKQGFFVAPANMPEPQFVYGENDYANVPSLITTDTVLHLFHLAFDSTLRNAEQSHLAPRVVELTAKMIGATTELRKSQKNAEDAEAARRVVAYFGVADRLFGQSTPLPEDVKDDVRAELASIAAHTGFAPSAVVPNKIDFSQFVVRGHYTKSPLLGRYFKAMAWYGMAPFELRDAAGNVRQQPVKMAVLVAQAMADPKTAEAWTAIYEPTTLYAGTVNSLTPLDVDETRRALGGSPDSATLVAALAKKDPSIYKPSMRLQTGVAQGVQMRFMGQRGLLDGWVISRVTDLQRPLPTGLDVFDALGCPRPNASWTAVRERTTPWDGRCTTNVAPRRAPRSQRSRQRSGRATSTLDGSTCSVPKHSGPCTPCRRSWPQPRGGTNPCRARSPRGRNCGTTRSSTASRPRWKWATAARTLRCSRVLWSRT